MKLFTFYRTNSNFDDILKDPNLKRHIHQKISWRHHLTIGIEKENDALFSYITLKYGDDMKEDFITDFTPKIGVDYQPKRT
jgi:hypothetical protein